MPMLRGVSRLVWFDCGELYRALDDERMVLELDWYSLAEALWEQSSALNRRAKDHPICGGAIRRFGVRGSISCQYAMFILRWLDRPPEDFLLGPAVDVHKRLPRAGKDRRLRWSLPDLYAAVDRKRVDGGLTWTALGAELECTASRLTNLRMARQADMTLVMRATQWLGRPAAAFIHPADW
jgi:hypothetical protein